MGFIQGEICWQEELRTDFTACYKASESIYVCPAGTIEAFTTPQLRCVVKVVVTGKQYALSICAGGKGEKLSETDS